MGTIDNLSRRALRPHQVAAHDDIVNSLESLDRALFVSACGTGKTITLQAVCNTVAPAGLIGAFFPSLFLVGQTLREWRTQYEDRWNTPIVVCSDASVADRGDDETRVSAEDLEAYGAIVTTDPVHLSGLLAQASPDLPQVVFATYHSSDKIAEAQARMVAVGHPAAFELVILDEAHRVTPGSALGLHVLDASSILAHKRLAATATPRQFHITAEGERGDEGDLLDETIYGPIAHEYGLRQAIGDGVLCDYSVHATVIAEEHLGALVDLDDDELRLHLGVAALHRARHQLGAGRIITYLRSVERARRFVLMAQDSGIDAFVITGDDPASDRRAILEAAFGDSPHGVVANVRCLTEGVDVPNLDAVLFVDPRKAKVDTVQAVGRVLRRAPGKHVGRIIIPVLAGPEEPDSWIDRPGWDIMASVLAQMAENDTAIRGELRTYASVPRDADAVANYPGSRRIHVDFPHNAVFDLGDRPFFAFDTLLADLSLRAVRVFDRGWDWNHRLQAVLDFKSQHDRLPSRYAGDTGESQLARWLAKQRATATNQQSAVLDDQVPGWRATRRSEYTWLRNLDALIAFHEMYGRMPRNNAADPIESSIAGWARVQRRSVDLHEDRRTLLQSRFPEVDWKPRETPLWVERFEALDAFIKVRGRLPRPDDGREAFRLRGWFQQQGKSKRLSAERVGLLNERMPGWQRNTYSPPA
ncbi:MULTISPECIES: DEAD/DEAH box helicase family protein [unclassified Microbacterium]|uniref:DEAD/DEAH box helicase n=1 Tax=unclassified Microbacterium TaxID=2609290 RepID=UPI0028832B59|nr:MULTISPECIES: DEAD/DEAH box helicase family protein [unclassified Microbacterium]